MNDLNRPHILCINPWIHDFAAYDFWAKPLGLLYIASILRDAGAKISYIDCLDRFHPKEKKSKILWDGRGPFRKTQIDLPDEFPDEFNESNKKFSRYGILPEWFVHDLNDIEQPDLILVTSLMTYWAVGVRETIEYIKKIYPDVPVVLGGIYASLCFEHAKKNSMADEVMPGPAENTLAQIINKYTNLKINVNEFQHLDKLPFPALDLQRKITYVPILTSRGCPFSCDYCASSFLEPKLKRRSFENVFDEIEYWYTNFKIKNFAFYDDALLVNGKEHAYLLFEKIIASGIDAWFHTPNALHVKEISDQAADLMYKAGFKTIRLGLETTDFSDSRSHDIKVKENEFSKAVENLKNAGFKSKQIGAYLLCGLPEQNLDEVENSVKFVKKSGITPVLAYYTPIPHTKMWNTALKNSKFNLNQHPVFTNNTLFPCINDSHTLKRISQLKNTL